MVNGDDNTACGGSAQQSLRRASAINCPNNKLGGKVKEGFSRVLLQTKLCPESQRERGQEPTEEEDEWKE